MSGASANSVAGSPEAVTRPGLPQIRTCGTTAYGSSNHGLAAIRYTEWTTRARGSGCRSSSRLNRSHVMRARFERLSSHFRQILGTS